MRIPIDGLSAEYRGQAPATEFENRQSGEVVELDPNLRFEVQLPDGDVEILSFRQGAVDKAADFDVSALAKGEEVVIDGMAVIGDARYEDGRKINGNSYLRLVSVRKQASTNGRASRTPAAAAA